jgi:ubiquinone/menaquinone biosynthesis C-methylase UbiE
MQPVSDVVQDHEVPRISPDYGLDAPPVIRNLVLGALAALGVLLAATLLGGTRILRLTMALTAAVCLVEAAWMVWASRRGKLLLRDRLLDALALRGDERVLDVGCGRGLLLLGAARRVPRGRAVGIDLWQAQDLSGNAAEHTLANARAEGVAERVEVHTGDMRSMPFADGSFELAVSNLAIHNLPGAAERARALREIARVVAPGGRVLLVDFAGTAAHLATLRELGWQEVKRSRPYLQIFPPVRAVSARKPGGVAG